MSYSNGFVEFEYLFFNLENNDEVAIHALHGRDEARRGAVLLKDVEENVMWLAVYLLYALTRSATMPCGTADCDFFVG